MNTRPLHETLKLLVEAARWAEIVSATDDAAVSASIAPEFSFFRGMALIQLNRLEEAILNIERGLQKDPSSRWGNKILFDARLASGRLGEAFTEFERFIGLEDSLESEKAWYVERAAELNLFDLASDMNDKRVVIKRVAKKPKYALAVQCFCKADTLSKVFSSLCNLTNADQFSLVIMQDSPNGSGYSEKYSIGCQAVEQVVVDWHRRLSDTFFSVEFLKNRSNCGTAPTCRRLIDYISSSYDGFLFIEDDCLLSPPALDWAQYHLEHNISDAGPWFVTCESSFFDRADRKLDPILKSRLENISRLRRLKDAYVLNDFVNSTCFGTTAGIWRICRNVRSFTRGPESLNRFVTSQDKKTIAPIVPRASDIGMLHELGYSVANLGEGQVREIKSSYLWSMERLEMQFCVVVDGDKDLLFKATSMLDEAALDETERQYFDRCL
jgi:hypothetical protein